MLRQLQRYTSSRLRLALYTADLLPAAQQINRLLAQRSISGQAFILATNSSQHHQINIYAQTQASLHLSCQRMKKYNKGKARQQESDDESDDEDEKSDNESDAESNDPLAAAGQDYVQAVVKVAGLRFDLVARGVFGGSRSKTEGRFLEDRFRIDNERVAKKSIEVSEGQVIDMIYGADRSKDGNLLVHRATIVEIDSKLDKNGKQNIKIHRQKPLSIENYEEYPFEGSTLDMTGEESK